MAAASSTLKIGDTAPEFTLPAANRFDRQGEAKRFSLKKLRARGPVLVEFLRGTW